MNVAKNAEQSSRVVSVSDEEPMDLRVRVVNAVWTVSLMT